MGFYHVIAYSFSGWGAGNGEGPHDRYLFGTAQKIPDWRIKITFLVKSGIKSRFAIISLSTCNAILGLWFSLNKYNIPTQKVRMI